MGARGGLLTGWLVALGCVPAAADSVWQAGARAPASLIADHKARAVGDIITILIKEETTAKSDLKESHAKESATKAAITEIKNILGYTRPDVTPSGKTRGLPSVDWSSTRTYDSEASAESKKSLEFRITAAVKEVLPNGNLLIEGRREIRHDRDVRLLHISGLVRPADVAADGTIASESIAQMRVSYENKGPGARTKNKGWGNWIVDILWPF